MLLLGIILSIGFTIKPDIPIEKLVSKYAPAPSKFVNIDGMNVHYRVEGQAHDSLPIVLIHGTGSSLHTYDAWTSELMKIKKVIRMDLPGFGLTGPFPDRDYSIKEYVDFLETFVENLKIKRFILAGNSLGGNIAWNYTIQHSDRVEKLILIDASGLRYAEKKPPLAFKIARTPVLNKILTFVTPKSVVKKSLEDVYTDKSKVTEQLVDRYYELSLREGNRQAMVDRFKSKPDYDMIPKIKNIMCPVLILWGNDDELVPPSCAQEFSNLLLNDTTVIIRQCGHVPMEECPTQTLQAVVKFLNAVM